MENNLKGTAQMPGPFLHARRWRQLGMAALCCTLLPACSVLHSYREQGQARALSYGFSPAPLSDTRLKAFLRQGNTSGVLVVYIEGDGAPWLGSTMPPADPTPQKPLVLNLAHHEAAGPVAYLGRPCQYLEPGPLAQCPSVHWTSGRFSADLVAASNRSIDELKHRAKAGKVRLVGYSGGGAMAALIASQRQDVDCLVTIAAPLDTHAWTQSIGVSPLRNSLNPAEHATQLRALPQTHFQGEEDEIVPPKSNARFHQAVAGAASQVITVAGVDHESGWQDRWPQLRERSCLAR